MVVSRCKRFRHAENALLVRSLPVIDDAKRMFRVMGKLVFISSISKSPERGTRVWEYMSVSAAKKPAVTHTCPLTKRLGSVRLCGG